MPSAAKLAHGALEYSSASHASRTARANVPIDRVLTTIATAAAADSAAISDSACDARMACHTERPSFRLGVRRNAASFLISPRRQASATTQLSANQQRRQRMASPRVHLAVVLIAHRARPTPV